MRLEWNPSEKPERAVTQGKFHLDFFDHLRRHEVTGTRRKNLMGQERMDVLTKKETKTY